MITIPLRISMLDLTERELLTLALDIGRAIGYGRLIMALSSAWRLVLARRVPSLDVDALIAGSFADGFRPNLPTENLAALLAWDRAAVGEED